MGTEYTPAKTIAALSKAVAAVLSEAKDSTFAGLEIHKAEDGTFNVVVHTNTAEKKKKKKNEKADAAQEPEEPEGTEEEAGDNEE